MSPETIEEEIQNNGSRKINIGVRCYPELKNKLSAEATDLGITLSEHTENILLNKDTLLIEKENAKEEAQEHKTEVLKLKALLADYVNKLKDEVEKGRRLKAENEKLNFECRDIKEKMIIKDDQLTLYSNKRLLDLFEKLEGFKDTIDTPDGQKIQITYDTPKKILEAMLYSYKYKKP